MTYRATKRTPEIVAEILKRIADGESLRAVCRSREEMPAVPTFLEWCDRDEALAEQYARAMEQRADAVFDELFEIADGKTDDVQRDRLSVDTRKWAIARMNPKKYGEKLDLKHSGKLVNVNISGEDAGLL